MTQPIHVGWREWLALPELGIDTIKAKVDTGARTSALHTFYIESFNHGGKVWVRFGIHPIQKSNDTEIHCSALVTDQRTVRDSGGHSELRYVIETPVVLGSQTFTAEVTLTNRENMQFRMLLGRTALKHQAIVVPWKSYLTGSKK